VNDEGLIDVTPTDRTETLPDGREMQDVEVLLSEDAHKRIRMGYQCGRCFEVHLVAWVEHCRLCGFPIGTVQREFCEREFVGPRVLRTSMTQEELADGERRLHELLEARRR